MLVSHVPKTKPLASSLGFIPVSTTKRRASNPACSRCVTTWKKLDGQDEHPSTDDNGWKETTKTLRNLEYCRDLETVETWKPSNSTESWHCESIPLMFSVNFLWGCRPNLPEFWFICFIFVCPRNSPKKDDNSLGKSALKPELWSGAGLPHPAHGAGGVCARKDVLVHEEPPYLVASAANHGGTLSRCGRPNATEGTQ